MTEPTYSAIVPDMSAPVYHLAGKKISNGWTIREMIVPGSCATGGCFSCGYIVVNTAGECAFLKAFDFSAATNDPDPALRLNAMTSAFIFERELLNRCKARQLKRVVTALGAGTIPEPTAPGGVIYYLVFERADCDVRARIDSENRFEIAWRLRTLHHVATAIQQLHGAKIAHQDVKPSNILLFAEEGSKLADLGRAACHGLRPPHEEDDVPGDEDYAPPELLYGHQGEWGARRLGCDLYLLGSMIVFFFTNQATTHLLLKHLEDSLRPPNFFGRYIEVLPYIRNAFGHVLTEFSCHVQPESLRSELAAMVATLCDPDPTRRGLSMQGATMVNQFSLQRYISRFNALAVNAEMGLR